MSHSMKVVKKQKYRGNFKTRFGTKGVQEVERPVRVYIIARKVSGANFEEPYDLPPLAGA